MARKPSPQAMRDRAAKTAAAMAAPGGTVAAPKKGGLIDGLRNTPRLISEVRAEARKITWTSRKETWITSVMVAIMVVLAAIFFFVVNWILNWGITTLLQLSTAG